MAGCYVQCMVKRHHRSEGHAACRAVMLQQKPCLLGSMLRMVRSSYGQTMIWPIGNRLPLAACSLSEPSALGRALPRWSLITSQTDHLEKVVVWQDPLTYSPGNIWNINGSFIAGNLLCLHPHLHACRKQGHTHEAHFIESAIFSWYYSRKHMSINAELPLAAVLVELLAYTCSCKCSCEYLLTHVFVLSLYALPHLQHVLALLQQCLRRGCIRRCC